MARNIYILLVEDEDTKSRNIERFLRSIDPTLTIDRAKSVTSALDALENKLPDLLLLDMSLPTFDVSDRERGGRPQGFGGREVLREMLMSNLACPTVVITGYEAFPREAGNPMGLPELTAELEAEFPKFLRGVLHYNSTYDEWKIQLNKVLREYWGN